VFRTAFLLVLALAPLARADYLEELRRGSASQAAADLVKLAKWCKSKKLYRTRLDLYRRVLELDPETANSRRSATRSRPGSRHRS